MSSAVLGLLLGASVFSSEKQELKFCPKESNEMILLKTSSVLGMALRVSPIHRVLGFFSLLVCVYVESGQLAELVLSCHE